MSTRSEALKSLVTALGWRPESETTSGLISQLSRMVDVSDGQLSVKEAPAYVAKVGKRWFDSMDAAVKASKGATVTLLADVGGFVVPSGCSLTLDLNGHTVSASGTAIENHGSLTVRGEGVVESTGSFAIASCTDSRTVVMSGTVRSVEGAIITGKSTGATIIVSGGTFSASDNAVLAGNGSAGFGHNNITVTGGTFEGAIKTSGYVACGIYCPNDDVVTVSGGTFNVTGGCGICARAGKVTVSGGTFSCTGKATGKVGDSRVVVPCAAVVFDAEAAYPSLRDDAIVRVMGGTFDAASSAVAHVGDPSHISVSAGSFSSSVPEDCCEVGFEPCEVGDRYSVRRK